MSVNSEAIKFYDSGSCPFAHRTWLALVEKGLHFDTTRVDLQNKPQEFKDLYASVNPDPNASAKVPIIIDTDGTTLIESNLTVQYLDWRYPDSGTRLLPESPAERAKVQLFVDTFGEKFTPLLFSTLRAGSPEELQRARDNLLVGLKVLDGFLVRHGSEEDGDYFLGGRYSYAETATTPFVRRALLLLPAYRDVDPLQLARSNGLDRLARWFEASLARPSNKATGPTDEELLESAKRFLSPMK